MFKKLTIFATLATLLFALALPALAEKTQVDVYEGTDLVKSVVFVVGEAEYYVNGATPGVQMDVAPYIDQDRTFVPVRYLGYALGVQENGVTWDNALRKASLTLPPNTVELAIGDKRIVTNGQAQAIDVAPQLKYDRTFLPARFVAEGLGYSVKFEQDGGLDYVICWPKGAPEPDVSAVKDYVAKNTLPPGVKPMPAQLVTDEADMEGIPAVAVRPWPNGKTKLYKGYVTVADLPVQVDGHVVYGLEITEGKYGSYEGEAVIVTSDVDFGLDLIIVEKDGRVRNRQQHTHWDAGDGKVALQYSLQHTGELRTGPPVDLKNVKYFAVNTAGYWRDGEIGLLFIANPYSGN